MIPLRRGLDSGWSRRSLAAVRMLPCRTGHLGHVGYKPFVIIGDRRTGTNMLLNLLLSTGHVAGFAELFSKVKPFWAGRSHAPIRSEKARVLRDEDPVRFLETCVFRRYPRSIRAVGFKAHYGQLERFPGSIDHLCSIPDLQILHIRRSDMLATYVSGAVARSTGRYLLRPGERRETPPGIEIDVPDLLGFLRRYAHDDDWPARRMPGVTVHRLVYENLARSPAEVLRPVLDALDLGDSDVRPLTERQSTQGWRAVALNADDVERALRSTEWEHLVAEPR